MLHIVLLILKIMGIILLSAIGIIMFIFLIILLNPAVYQFSLSGENTIDSIKLHFKFHWLYHLLSGFLIFENGKLIWKFRAAWKTFCSDDTNHTDHSDHFSSADKTKLKAEPVISVQEKLPDKNRSMEKNPKTLSADTLQHHGEKSSKKTKKKSPVSGIIKFKNKIISLYNRICIIPQKIKYTIEAFCDKIKALTEKKDKIVSFVENDIHKKAFRRFLKELKRFLKLMTPSKAFLNLQFGFDDPAYTGYLLAGLSLLYPCLGQHAHFNADFDHKILCGNLLLKGRFRAVYALIFVLGMLIDINVRQTYRHIRKFKI